MEEKIICTHCDQPVDCGYELVNGQIVCSDCVSHYCCVCDRCGATIWDTDAFGDEYTNLCRSCYENFYVRCERCECLIHTDDAYEYDGCDYCSECYHDCCNENSPIKEYGYKPEPIFYGNGNRYFGVELEIDIGGRDSKYAQELLDIANEQDEHIYIKSDGSLNDGIEIVTHPMTLDYHKYFNWNNHPFIGHADKYFAFAHNGVLYNDTTLRKEKKLPPTCIETDSYVAVQLIEKHGKLDFDGLKSMAEDVQGNFTFTFLDEDNTLYFVKGSSPMYLIYFEIFGLYVYASTESIMKKALKAVGLHKYNFEEIAIHEEDILSIDINGHLSRSEYESYRHSLFSDFYAPYDNYYSCHEELLLEMCGFFGVSEEDVLTLLEYGYTSEEIEDLLYNSDLIERAVREIREDESIKLCI